MRPLCRALCGFTGWFAGTARDRRKVLPEPARNQLRNGMRNADYPVLDTVKRFIQISPAANDIDQSPCADQGWRNNRFRELKNGDLDIENAV